LFHLQEAKAKFQQLQNVISILGDEEKRALYDETGCVDHAVSLSIFQSPNITNQNHRIMSLLTT